MQIRDRIKELRRVKANQLLPNPANWRTHPTAQADALKGILAEIDRRGAGMYRGQLRATGVDSDPPANHAGEGGAIPTVALS